MRVSRLCELSLELAYTLQNWEMGPFRILFRAMSRPSELSLAEADILPAANAYFIGRGVMLHVSPLYCFIVTFPSEIVLGDTRAVSDTD